MDASAPPVRGSAGAVGLAIPTDSLDPPSDVWMEGGDGGATLVGDARAVPWRG